MGFFSGIGEWIHKALPTIGSAIGSIFGQPGAGASIGKSVQDMWHAGYTDEGEERLKDDFWSSWHKPSDGGQVEWLPGVTVTGIKDFAQAIGGLGGVGSAVGNYLGAREQNAANAEQAQKQMDFQERMSNTSWQRGVADMKAAGLNPALAYGQGGASSASGASAHMENTVAPGISSAMQAMDLAATLRQKDATTQATYAQADATEAQAARTRSETIANALHTGRAESDIYKNTASARQAEQAISNMQTTLIGQELANKLAEGTQAANISRAQSEAASAKYGLSGDKAAAEFYDWAGGAGKIAPLIGSAVNSAVRGIGRLGLKALPGKP